jgi:hypothetical protein
MEPKGDIRELVIQILVRHLGVPKTDVVDAMVIGQVLADDDNLMSDLIKTFDVVTIMCWREMTVGQLITSLEAEFDREYKRRVKLNRGVAI